MFQRRWIAEPRMLASPSKTNDPTAKILQLWQEHVLKDVEVVAWLKHAERNGPSAECIGDGSYIPFTDTIMASRLTGTVDVARGLAFNIVWFDMKTKGMKGQFPQWDEVEDEGNSVFGVTTLFVSLCHNFESR